ncbi:MAG: FtsW/RodA/SpoVE family cell cycle protein [Candidatus Cryptobacteroides sp.]
MTSSTKKKIWNYLDHMEGDKVVWMIMLILMLISILLIFSSSSRLIDANNSRVDIAFDHLKVVIGSLILVIIIYNIKNIEFFRKCSRFGFCISLILLIALLIFGTRKNGAVRFIMIGGFQFHVFEVVKVAMMMYIAYAIDALENKRPLLIEHIFKDNEKLTFLKKPNIRKLVLLYIPFICTVALVAKGSNTAALFLALIMIVTIMVGTKDYKITLILGGLLLSIAIIAFSTYSISKNRGDNPPKFERIGTAIGRIVSGGEVKQFKEATDPVEKQNALDKIYQPYSARIAIHQGKATGKGPGQSTQRYIVPDMSADYMFSFIIEEYGLLAFFVLALYLSLVARGTLIIKNCANNIFAKCAIFGLVLLISGQAFIHIFVNMDPGILTGQTLPLLSHGSFSFLCFSIAFGIILSISRIANKGMERASKEAASLSTVETKDTVSEGLSDLDNFESNGEL